MSSIRINLLRNSPIKVIRDNETEVITIQGPTVGELYSDRETLVITQLLTSSLEDLKKMTGIDGTSEEEILRFVFDSSTFSPQLFNALKKIIPEVELDNNFLVINDKEISNFELKRIRNLLEIMIGKKEFQEKEEKEKELSPAAKRMLEIEKKLEQKKEEKSKKKMSEYPLEDVLVALTYEFKFSIEEMMNMNYFTLLWYYSYVGKIHGYRITTAAIGAGVGKDFDYFTNIK